MSTTQSRSVPYREKWARSISGSRHRRAQVAARVSHSTRLADWMVTERVAGAPSVVPALTPPTNSLLLGRWAWWPGSQAGAHPQRRAQNARTHPQLRTATCAPPRRRGPGRPRRVMAPPWRRRVQDIGTQARQAQAAALRHENLADTRVLSSPMDLEQGPLRQLRLPPAPRPGTGARHVFHHVLTGPPQPPPAAVPGVRAGYPEAQHLAGGWAATAFPTGQLSRQRWRPPWAVGKLRRTAPCGRRLRRLGASSSSSLRKGPGALLI